MIRRGLGRLLAGVLLLSAVVLAACEPFFSEEELDRVTNRGHIEVTYRQWWQREFDAYVSGGYTSGQPPMFSYGLVAPEARLDTPMPASVRDAFTFYFERVEQADWGNVHLINFVLNEDDELWLVRVTTDGDDGWVEVYSGDGRWLEGGRTWIELIAWIETEVELPGLREQVATGAFPPALEDRVSRTLWQP